MRRSSIAGFVLVATLCAPSAHAQSTFHWNGFALVRGTSAPDEGPLEAQPLSSQLQVGADWLPTSHFAAHVHLLARNPESSSLRGTVGVPEAWVQGEFHPRGDRLRVRAGAMFLPTSLENVDSLWETAYTLTPSALNSWLGEEFRPIGVDASYSHHGFSAGATIFRGNDTFGALPPVRGWAMRDHWIVLGEWIKVDDEYFTSVSAENDHNPGWSARGGWSGSHVTLQLTHIDNRSDALDYGELFNWNTRFDIAAAEYSNDRWTVAAESGWGPTVIIVQGNAYESQLSASYLLVSRLLPHGRATLRGDLFRNETDDDFAITAAYFHDLGRIRAGGELITTGDDHRLALELRYNFAAN